MKGKRLMAVELLLSYPDSVVAEMLGVRLGTLQRWMDEPDFTDAMRQREKEQKKSLVRIARQAAVRSAAAMCQAAGEQSKPDAKALIEVLKLSKAYEVEETDPEQALAEIIRIAANATDEDEE